MKTQRVGSPHTFAFVARDEGLQKHHNVRTPFTAPAYFQIIVVCGAGTGKGGGVGEELRDPNANRKVDYLMIKNNPFN